MISHAWKGNWQVTQPFGRTDFPWEPWWALKRCFWHCGIDIGMPMFTPIYAARAGRVAYRGYALLAIQVGGELDWYIHIDSAVAGYRDFVEEGQLIAYSGAKAPSGGASTGPHLHFETQLGVLHVVNGLLKPLNDPPTSVDPMPILSRLYVVGGGELTARTRRRRTCTVATTKSLHEFCRGGDLALYHRRRAGGTWSPWVKLGGRLGSPEINAGVDDQGTIIVSVTGGKLDGSSNGLFYDYVSTDDGVTFTAPAANEAGGDGLTIMSVLEPTVAAAAVDLSGVLQAVNVAAGAARDAASDALAARAAAESAAAAASASLTRIQKSGLGS